MKHTIHAQNILTKSNYWINAERSKGVEFYNFLQVNTDHSNKSEVIDHAKKDKQDEEEEEEEDEDEVEQKAALINRNEAASPPFIDFLSVGAGLSWFIDRIQNL